METEILAVSAVQTVLAHCALLTPVIASNDKTMLTDGHIDVFRAAPKKKATLQGRVNVQVKGRTRHGKLHSSLKFAVAVLDLQFYMRNSGVLYFVVAFNPRTRRQRSYYKMLSPYKIDWLLQSLPPDAKYLQLGFDELPEDPVKIERIVRLALKKSDENAALGFDPSLFENARELTIHSANGLSLDQPVILSPGDTDFALILTTEAGMKIPLAGELHVLPSISQEQVADIRIRSGTVSYDRARVKQTGEASMDVKLSEGLVLAYTFGDEGYGLNVTLTMESDLENRVKAIEFFLSLAESGEIAINDSAGMPLVIPPWQGEPELRRHLARLHEHQALLDYLGVAPRLIDLTLIDDTQDQQLHDVYRALVEGMHFEDTNGAVSRVRQQLAGWSLMLLMIPSDVDGLWRLIDPFHPDSRQQFRGRKDGETADETVLITAYDTIEDDWFPDVVNTRLDVIADAYQLIADEPHVLQTATMRVLALIQAADSRAARREEFLGGADRLNDWILSHDAESPNHLLNRWQIIARRQTLAEDMRTGIRELRRNLAVEAAPDARLQEVACAILLEDAEEVEFLVARLDDETREILTTWPIWNLHIGRASTSQH